MTSFPPVSLAGSILAQAKAHRSADLQAMWLLDTNPGIVRLQWFDEPPPRYAILSHVWQQNEQDFQSIATSTIAAVTSKIKESCTNSRDQGFRWLWIDTCCIDKTNSVELSEAINSMYRWYARATVCFAYLYDVRFDEDPFAKDSTFRRSVWFTRGWTLQELIAPGTIIFFSGDWTIVGTKHLLSSLLEDITGIDSNVLTFHKPLSSISVATRLSWAAKRRTTRIEDSAYSLMGIFDIFMPTIYGEGMHAFRRLQEEIMKTSCDHTLFTWGPMLTLSALPAPSSRHFVFNLVSDNHLPSTSSTDHSLIASSTSAFAVSSDTWRPEPLGHILFQDFLRRLSLCASPRGQQVNSTHGIPEFSLIGHGFRAHLPVIDIPSHLINIHEKCSIALIPCQLRLRDKAMLIGLIICRKSGSYLNRIGATFRGHGFARYVAIDLDHSSTSILLRHPRPSGSLPAYRWTDVYIAHATNISPYPQKYPITSMHPSNAKIIQEVIITGTSAKALREQGFNLVNSSNSFGWRHRVDYPSFHNPLFVFAHPQNGVQIRIHAGRCREATGMWLSVELVDIRTYTAVLAEPVHDMAPSRSHDCSLIHVEDWGSHLPADINSHMSWDATRSFQAFGYTISLSLATHFGSQQARGDGQYALRFLGVNIFLPQHPHPQLIPASNTPPWSQGVEYVFARQLETAANDFLMKNLPSQPSLISREHQNVLIFFSKRRHEEVHVITGLCTGAHGRRLWTTVRFVERSPSKRAMTVEPTHELSHRELGVRCTLQHVHDWELILPNQSVGGPEGRSSVSTDTQVMPLARAHTFSALGRTVRVRVFREQYEHPMHTLCAAGDGTMWVLDVDFPVTWGEDLPPLP